MLPDQFGTKKMLNKNYKQAGANVKPRVAFISQPWDSIVPHSCQSAIPVWICSIANSLSECCEVYVFGLRFRDQKSTEFCHNVRYKRFSPKLDNFLHRIMRKIRTFPDTRKPLFTSTGYFLGYAAKVALALRANKIDIVHIHSCTQFIPTIRLINPKIKIVLHIHCEWLTQLDTDMVSSRLEKIDAVIGCSKFITSSICDKFPQHAVKCRTIYNGATLRENGKADVVGSRNGKKAIFAGRVSPEKGVHVLIQAFKEVVKRHPEAKLEIVGPQNSVPLNFLVNLSEDPQVKELERFYRGSYMDFLGQEADGQLKKSIFFVGPTDQSSLFKRFSQADVFVLPSVCNEAFSLTILEAMSMGLPVVATKAGGTPESVLNAQTGLLVEKNDPAGLAEAISMLFEEDDYRRQLGKAARKRLVEEFSWEKISREIFNLYESLLNGKT